MTGKGVFGKDTAAMQVCEEAPVQLIYNGHDAVTFMCTPRELKALALGWLFSQGLITGVSEVYVLGACDDMRKIYVQTAVDRWEERRAWNKVLTSGCGGGTILAAQLAAELPKIAGDLQISKRELSFLIKEMVAKATLYRKTGGVHSAALAAGGQIVAHSEDIGRHNALDKVLGKGLLQELDFTQMVLLTTGRISCEMTLKAAHAGVPVIASLTTPTSLAVELASRAGITIVGRAAGRRMAVYCGRERITPAKEHRLPGARGQVWAEG